ncbi:MAG: S46 family peptidase [Marinilabilia sp.]
MWLPWHLSQSQIEEMHKMGLELSSNDLFSSDQASIKDAIVSLDDGSCTGSFISDKGLLLTNHHCAMGEIQQHSSLENDYISDGFWARSSKDELPNEDKTATILVEARDLTPLFKEPLEKVSKRVETEDLIDSISTAVLDTLTIPDNHDAEIKEFFSRNQFYLLITQTFRDVRLVGAPPKDIGQFGAEEDNWMWPRHSADFTFFRVYTSPDGEPADYHPDNIPYEPEKVLPVNPEGGREGDFTMVMGYPGKTQRYLTSHGIRETKDIINPIVAEVRGKRQEIWKEHMEGSEKIGIQYAEKYATSSNYQKYAIGQNKSIENTNLTSKREKHENKFSEWLDENPETPEEYDKILSSAKLLYLMRQNLAETTIITLESLINGPDINSLMLDAYELYNIVRKDDSGEKETKIAIEDLREKGENFFPDFSAQIDKEVFQKMVEFYTNNLTDSLQMDREVLLGNTGSIEELSEKIYTQSAFADPEEFEIFLRSPKAEKFEKDPGFAFVKRVMEDFSPVYSIFQQFEEQLEHTMHQYVDALMKRYPEHRFYPDANSTMRFTAGKISNYSPDDGIVYSAFSTHKGIIQKINSGNDHYQPDYPLKTLMEKDFSRYADDSGNLPVCFISDNDITGGNSGSPVLNGKGELIGLAFDGNWEGMASDISYSKEQQRCINADIRYILYVMEEVGDADHLLAEMNLKN